MNRSLRGIARVVVPALLLVAADAGQAWAKRQADGEAVLNAKCASCHEAGADGTLARVGEQRKTPEGWLMTLRRMRQWHGVQLTEDEEQVLLKHLSDTLGLAPQEAAPFRYALERRPGIVETPDDAELAAFCGRCHTYARVGLQRRDAHEWTKLAHMHLGQWPTLEYQAQARDRQWWALATTDIAKKLAEKWPMTTAGWTEWRKRKPVDLSGTWRIAGHQPGKGDYAGKMTVKRRDAGTYAVSYDLSYADGGKASGAGSSVVYTGYEWRGSVSMGKADVQQVFAVAPDGNSLAGRWFLDGESAIGGDLKAVRSGGGKAILDVQPAYVKAGGTARITVVGTGLGGEVAFGPGISVVKAVTQSPEIMVFDIRAVDTASPGPCVVAVGDVQAPMPLVVYDRIGSVRVQPSLDMARVGGDGGPVPTVSSQFEAVGYMNGPDGKPGSDDDIRIGVMPAAWAVADFDHEAVKLQDAKFGGTIDQAGLFRPAKPGINPARGGLLNNFANLRVTATVTDGAAKVEGSGHLIVVPQRWNDPPIL